MGVWHISGLGQSPGALTVPTACLYLLLKKAQEGDPAALEFFSTSGEYSQEKGTLRGFPEGFVIFTSEKILQEEIDRKVMDSWFKKPGSRIRVPKVVCRFIRDLHSSLFEGFDLPEIYYLIVDHQDFKKTAPVIFQTVHALGTRGGKELWANMVAGTNQINASILAGGAWSGAISRYYYYFEQATELLHPDIPSPIKGVSKSDIDQILSKWFRLPIFDLDRGKATEIITKLMLDYEGRVPLKCLKEKLNENGFDNHYIAKLQGSRLIVFENEVVRPGPELNQLSDLLSGEHSPNNLSEWTKWAAKRGILWKQEIDQDCRLERVEV